MNTMTKFLGHLRWRKAALPVSLAVNIFLLAYAGGQWAGTRTPGIFRIDPQRPIERLAKRLPTADAALLREAFRTREAAFAAARKDYAEAVEQVLALMAQPQLDVPALRTAIAAARDHRQRMDGLLAGTVLAAIEKMPGETRAAFAKSFKRKAAP